MPQQTLPTQTSIPLSIRIASAVMDTIEDTRRINKNELSDAIKACIEAECKRVDGVNASLASMLRMIYW